MDFDRPLSEYEREAMIIGGPEDGHETTGIMRFARVKKELLNSINSNKIKQEYVIKKMISGE